MASTYHRLEKRPTPQLISIVAPCYNEEKVIPILREKMTAFCAALPCPVEVILVNDGSSDATIELLWQWAEDDKRIKVIGFARNFGHQPAVSAGMDAAKGDAVIIIDADLQDPLDVIHEMLSRYCEGYDIVFGQREERSGESKFKLITAWIFYRLMRKLVHKDLPVDAGDFRLISRPALDTLNAMRETHRFLRGMGAWVGFAQCPVKYKRASRVAGETKYPFRKMLKFAWTAAISFSPLPLRISLGLGLIVAFVGFIAGIYAVFQALMHFFNTDSAQVYSPGWATLVTLICLIGGAILIALGILGEYVGRIFEEIKDRPLYVVSVKKNLD
jgi:glycosyltransferase involved in cell wall biosynthesis